MKQDMTYCVTLMSRKSVHILIFTCLVVISFLGCGGRRNQNIYPYYGSGYGAYAYPYSYPYSNSYPYSYPYTTSSYYSSSPYGYSTTYDPRFGRGYGSRFGFDPYYGYGTQFGFGQNFIYPRSGFYQTRPFYESYFDLSTYHPSLGFFFRCRDPYRSRSLRDSCYFSSGFSSYPNASDFLDRSIYDVYNGRWTSFDQNFSSTVRSLPAGHPLVGELDSIQNEWAGYRPSSAEEQRQLAEALLRALEQMTREIPENR